MIEKTWRQCPHCGDEYLVTERWEMCNNCRMERRKKPDECPHATLYLKEGGGYRCKCGTEFIIKTANSA